MKLMEMKTSHLTAHLPRIACNKLNCNVNEIKFIGGGSFGKAFKCKLDSGETVVLKAYRNPENIEHDALSLELLRKSTSVKIPAVHFSHTDSDCAVLAMDFIEGKNVLDPVFLLKSSSQKQAFAQEVVKGLLEIHSITSPTFGELSNPIHSSWLSFYRNTIVEPQLNQLKELCDKRKYSNASLSLLLEATELFFNTTDEPDEAVLIHADLNIMNIMADPRSFKLTGFIDPGYSMWADREYDLFQFLNMWGSCYGLLDEYQKQHKLSPHSDFKIAYYAALNEASCRLKGGLIMPAWEIQCNARLRKAMKHYI